MTLTGDGGHCGYLENLRLASWAERQIGGLFDSAEPTVGPGEPYGTMTIHFADCENGTVRYDLPQAGVSGAVPIRRIVTDLVPLCEALKTPTGQ